MLHSSMNVLHATELFTLQGLVLYTFYLKNKLAGATVSSIPPPAHNFVSDILAPPPTSLHSRSKATDQRMAIRGQHAALPGPPTAGCWVLWPPGGRRAGPGLAVMRAPQLLRLL